MARLAAFSAQAWRGPTLWLAGLSVLAYLTIAMQPRADSLAALCGRARTGGLAGLQEGAALRTLAVDWILMVVAMMSPLVGGALAYVVRMVHGPQKGPATLAFLLSYLSVWIVSGLVLVPAALALSLVAGATGSKGILLGTVAGALLWTMSPPAQRARNACHRCGRIAAFGLDAQADSSWLGLKTGAACVAACWPVMLVPLLVAEGHLPAMILAGLVLFADRVAPPAPVSWRLPPFVETFLGVGLIRNRRPAPVGGRAGRSGDNRH